MQLKIKPGLRRVWRAADTLQIGLSQRRGTVLGGLTPDDLPLIEQLRTGVEAATFGLVDAGPGAVDPGPGADRRRELVRLLTEAGVLLGPGIDPAMGPGPGSGSVPGTGSAAGSDPAVGTGTQVVAGFKVAPRPVVTPRESLGSIAERLTPDASIWSVVHQRPDDGWGLLAARSARRVVIVGAGRLGSSLAAILAAAGVGEVAVVDSRRVTEADLTPAGASAPDLGRPRDQAALDAVRRLGGRAGHVGATAEQWADGRPDLVVLIEYGAADATRAGRLVSSDLPHLSVVVREDDVVVGPLWRPGGGACLRCLDLHRGDRDPAWPSILTQLLGPAAGGVQPEETALSALAAGLTSLQVLGQLDGVVEPATVGATLEIELPDGLIARRGWPAHSRCGCHWPAQPETSFPAVGGPPEGGSGDSRAFDSEAGPDRRGAASPADARRSRVAGRMRL